MLSAVVDAAASPDNATPSCKLAPASALLNGDVDGSLLRSTPRRLAGSCLEGWSLSLVTRSRSTSRRAPNPSGGRALRPVNVAVERDPLLAGKLEGLAQSSRRRRIRSRSSSPKERSLSVPDQARDAGGPGSWRRSRIRLCQASYDGGGWIPTRSATRRRQPVPRRKVGSPIPTAGLLLGFRDEDGSARRISSPFSDARVALRAPELRGGAGLGYGRSRPHRRRRCPQCCSKARALSVTTPVSEMSFFEHADIALGEVHCTMQACRFDVGREVDVLSPTPQRLTST